MLRNKTTTYTTLVLLLFLMCPNLSYATESEHPFVKNKGQWNEKVQFKANWGSAVLFLEKSAFHYQFIDYPDVHDHDFKMKNENVEGHTFRAEFVDANEAAEIFEKNPSFSNYNYFLGNDKSRWKSDVKAYQEVHYQNLYDKIDLNIYQKEGGIKYDFILESGADVKDILIHYKGADALKIRNGQLYVSHSLGNLIEAQPYAYQVVNGQEIKVECDFFINELGQVGFSLGEFDDSKTLIIDPELIFSTYSGSRFGNFGMTATYDKLGNGYMGGTIFSTGYDTTLGAFQRAFQGGASDIVISKFNSDGDQLLYATYIGGSSAETVNSMVVDDSLNLSIFGVTGSADYPTTTNAYDTSKETSQSITFQGYNVNFPSGTDIIVTKLNPSGSQLIGSTFFGGDKTDGLNISLSSQSNNNINLVYNYGDHFRGEIIADSTGNIFIGTSTYSDSLGNSVSPFRGSQDGIVAKFNADLSQLVWTYYLGGQSRDAIYSLKIMDDGNILVGGGTQSFIDFPVSTNAYQSTSGGGRSDGFISKIAGDGSALVNSTFLGTSNYDQVYFIEFDRFGGIYALGQSFGGLFPLKNSKIADTLAGQFIIKLENQLDSVIYSTTFGDGLTGGAINISPTAFLVDRCQNVYASGWGGHLQGGGTKFLTNNMPITSNSFRNSTNTGDFYLYVMQRNADSLLYGSYFGGTGSHDHVDGGTSRFDKNGIIYQSVCASCASGLTNSDFPTTPNAYHPTKSIVTGNDCNNALFKFDFEILPTAKIKSNKLVVCAPDYVRIQDSSLNAKQLTWDFYGTPSSTQDLDTTILFSNPGTYKVTLIAKDTICNSFDTTFINIEVKPNPVSLVPISDVLTCDTTSLDLTAITNGTANFFYWSSNPQFSDTLNVIQDSTLAVKPGIIQKTYYLLTLDTLGGCGLRDTVNVRYFPLLAAASISSDTICEKENVQLNSNFVNAQEFKWDFGDGRLDSNNLNPSISFNQPGIYQISVEVSNSACPRRDTAYLDLVVDTNRLEILGLLDTTYCGADTLLLIGNSRGSSDLFIWSSQPGLIDTLNNNLQDSTYKIFNSFNGNLYFHIEDRHCKLNDEVFVQYEPYDVSINTIPDSLCSPGALSINTTQIGVDRFIIDFGNGQIDSINQNPSSNYSQPGKYYFSFLTENFTCIQQDVYRDSIQIEPNVSLSSLRDTMICLGDSVRLTGNSSGSASKFIWSDDPDFTTNINPSGDSSIIVSPDIGSNLFYLFGSRSICSDSTVVVVDVLSTDIDVDDVASICIGDTIDIVATNFGFGTFSYTWSPNDSIISGQGTGSIEVSPKGDLFYYIHAQNQIGCQDRDSILIQVFQPAFDDALITSSVDTAYLGQQVFLNTNRTGSNLQYFWEPFDGVSDPNSANPIITPNQTTTYKVTITDLNTGCQVFAFKRIVVYEINCGEPSIFIPSGFTPNQDFINDVLFVRGPNISELDFKLFNRWGELVFETTSLDQGWDGKYKGKESDPGVFVYHLSAKCLDGQEFFKKGNITLIR